MPPRSPSEDIPSLREADVDSKPETLEQAAAVLQGLLNTRSAPSARLQDERAAVVAQLQGARGNGTNIMRKLIEEVSSKRKDFDPARQGRISNVPYPQEEPEGFSAQLKHPELPAEQSPSTSALDAFLAEAGRADANLLHLDHSLTTQQIEERIAILDRLCFLYEHRNSNEVAFMQGVLIKKFGIPTIPKDAEAELSQLESMCNVPEKGVENKNLFYRKGGKYAAVLKITKQRHDDDFYSILKLMRNMHVVALRLNRDVPGEAFRAELPFEDMLVYRDEQGKFKRIIRQPYASGTPVRKLPKKVLDSEKYQRSWNAFLAHLRSMEKTDKVVLDATASDLGNGLARAEVNKTENVFARDEGDRYVFTVVDPDVFDTREGQHKFDPLAQLREGQRSIKAMIKAALCTITNVSRSVLEGRQNRSLRSGGNRPDYL